MSTITHPLRAWREARGWTQERLAYKSGVTWNTIGRLERGSTTVPHKETVEKLTKTLNLDVTQVFEFLEYAGKHQKEEHRAEPELPAGVRLRDGEGVAV